METEVLASAPEGKVALVTGSPAALCYDIADALDGRGVRTVVGVVGDRGESGSCGASAREALEVPLAALPTDEREFASLFDSAERAHGAVNIVVQVLEAAVEPARVTDLSLEAYDSITRQLARAPFFLLQQAARRLADGGKLILVQQQGKSGDASGGMAGLGAAAAVQVYARVLTRELGARGITVNTVSTGSTATPDEIARIVDLVNFLAGDDARWINGQRLQTSRARHF
jgi:3-oxoacyl-[acyl-carrier protein] reductase